MTVAEIIVLAAKGSIALMVFALGLRSRPGDLVLLLRRPGLLVRAFVAINVVVPLFAIAAVKLLPLRLDVSVALIALALSPIPPLLPGKASRAHGERAFAVALLVVFAVVAIIWVPLAVRIVGAIFDRPVGVEPRAIAWIVATLIVLPLGLGMALRGIARVFAERIEPAASRLSMAVLLLAALAIAAGAARMMLAQIGDGTVVLLAAFVLVGLAAGHVLGGPVPEERTDLALATGSRHPGIALVVAHAAFPDDRTAVALVVLYLLVNVVIGLPYVRWRSKASGPPIAGAAPHPSADADPTAGPLH